MPGLVGPLSLLLAEGGLVHEQLGAPAAASTHVRDGAPSPAMDHLAVRGRGGPAPARAPRRPVGERYRLAPLQGSPLAPCRDAQRVGGLDIETTGPLVLDAARSRAENAVLDGDGIDGVVVAVERSPGRSSTSSTAYVSLPKILLSAEKRSSSPAGP